MRKTIIVAFTLASLLVPSAALAATPGTQGDAQATLNSFLDGGRVVLFGAHHSAAGAPAYGGFDSRILLRPFASWDGRHLCQSDWKVLAMGWIDGNFPGDPVRTNEQILASMDLVSISMFVDGAPISTTRTATKRALQIDDLTDAFGFQQGTILAPSALTVGPHSFSVVTSDPYFGTTNYDITFYVDPAGTGVCL